MKERGRSIPEHVQEFAPYDRFLVANTFYKYDLHRDTMITLNNGDVIILRSEAIDELARQGVFERIGPEPKERGA
jgi:hypothetical protein